MTQADIGKRIDDYRLSQLWTLKQLEEHTGISVTTLGNIVSGRHKPHRLTLAKLKKAIPEIFESGKQ